MSPRTPRLSDLIRQPPTAASAPTAAPETPEPEKAADDTPGSREAPAVPAAPPIRIEPAPAEAEARFDYGLLEEWIGETFGAARAGRFEPGDLLETMRAILDRPHLLDALFAETFKTRQVGDPLSRKSLNVAIYALRLGRALNYSEDSLIALGAAALLAKLGLTKVPPELVAKPGALSARELARVREHPFFAREMIEAAGSPFEQIARIVYQANERIDGSGYPQGLRDGEILPEALVIGLVDVFEALIQPRPHRDRLVPFRAVKEIVERERARFPRALLREFIASFSLFPPFTYVRLNSRAIARVEETEAGFPLRPRVTVVLDANGQRPTKPQVLRLRESPLLYITGPVGEEELPV